MSTQELELIKLEAERFISYLQPENRPQLLFIYREHINESKLDEHKEKNVICFNIHFFQRLSFDFSMLIVLHEIFHFVKQGVKNSLQVAELRYNNLWPFMQLYDIEADLFVVDYLRKENILFNFKQYLAILHIGSLTFQNPTIRLVKLERFIGSLLTVKLFFKTNKTRLFLPKISLNSVTMIVIDFEAKHLNHHCFEIPTSHQEQWKVAFQKADQMDWTAYIDFINKLIDEFIEHSE